MTKNNKKTKAKRMGVKSVLAYGDGKVAITGFGKGNDARIAILTDKDGSNLAKRDEERNIIARESIPQVGIRTTGTAIDKDRNSFDLEVLLHNPAEKEGQDYLGLKSVLEEEFFEKENKSDDKKCEKTDNIRIQIIHNILDIQKLLGIYVNDVIYCINNLRNETDIADEGDILGLGSGKIKAGLKKMVPYFGFFGNAFVIPPKTSVNDETAKKLKRYQEIESKMNNRGTAQVQRLNLQLELDELRKEFPEAKKVQLLLKEYEHSETANKPNLAVMSILNKLRQITAHYNESHKLFTYNLTQQFGKDWSVIEKYFNSFISRINIKFCEHSALNVKIISELLKVSQENIIPEYYRFAILKEGKNLGVNMTTLREYVFDIYTKKVRDKKHDSYRQKINTIADFLLYRRFKDSEEFKEIVQQLRETENEETKKAIYKWLAKLAAVSANPLIKLLPEFESKVQQKIEPLSENSIGEAKLTSVNTSPFVQLLAFLCNFWEGKEINELLSAYIHKFENIQAFIDVLATLEGKKPQFTEKYALFNESNGERAGEIDRNLRILASIGKMKPDLEGAKRQLYKAAIEMLGVPDDSEFVSDEWLAENVLLDKSKQGYEKRKTEVNPFRNFIAKQVIESRRFMYLVRYTKPQTVKKLMKKEAIVRFVLQRIGNIKADHMTESQIDRYYQNLPSYREDVKVDLNTKIDRLTDYLVKYSFEKEMLQQKEGIIFNSSNPRDKKIEVEHLKAVTGLYLTVAYIAVKNLVKANALYYIAFSVFERDYALFKQKFGLSESDWKFGKFINLFAITEFFLDEDDHVNKDHSFVMQPNGEKFGKQFRAYLKTVRHHFDKHTREYLRKNLNEAKTINNTGWLLTAARNHAEHLNVLTNLPKYIADFHGETKEHNGKKRNLYFQLYHYVLQQLLFENESLKEPLREYAEKAKRFDTPCSDLINIMYVSLGYNLPRYKNLTIEGLFEKEG